MLLSFCKTCITITPGVLTFAIIPAHRKNWKCVAIVLVHIINSKHIAKTPNKKNITSVYRKTFSITPAYRT